MPLLSRVVWSEGMHLAQHHFQMQNRYFEDATTFAFSHLFFRPYGLVGCELDHDAVRNGTASLVHARGVMPDGLAFEFPGDVAPDPLEIAPLFSPTDVSRTLLLVIPPYQEGNQNCRLDGEDGAATRYIASTRAIPDETTGLDEKPVAVARKNFRLALGGPDAEPEAVVLPIARIQRDGSGKFTYDPSYIPPSLQIGASDRLLSVLVRLVEVLDAKGDMLAAERRQAGDSEGYASKELIRLWLTHTVNGTAALLRHHLDLRRAHPEQLYLELARLAGALCTFSMDEHPRDLPAYDHENLTDCFGALEERIRSQLELNLPKGVIELPLTGRAESHYGTRVADRRAFAGATWFLGVRSTLSRAELASRVEGLVKVCSEKFIGELVRRGMDGLVLEHEQAPPAQIAPRVGMEYFRIVTGGPCWESIQETGAVGVYVPDSVPAPELELRIVPGA